jgi:hypothetical protein
MDIGNGACALAEGYKWHFFFKAYFASGLILFGIESITEGNVGGRGFF